MKKQTKKIFDWAIVFFYILFIYLSLPWMPRLWEAFVRKAGDFANYVTAFILGLIGLFVVFYLIAKRKNTSSFIGLIVLVFAYGWGLSKLELAIERIHFLEYGLLSLFVFKALRHSIKNKFLYFWSGIIVFCLGWLDEGIQYILPSRVYDTRDVIVNGIAGILGLLVIPIVRSPRARP